MKPKTHIIGFLCSILAVCSIVSCGDSSDEPTSVLSLSQSNVTIVRCMTQVIEISMGQAKQATSDNDFVAYAYLSGNRLEIVANKVGNATIAVTDGISTVNCKVTVTPVNTEYGEPYLAYGASIQDVRQNAKGVITEEGRTYVGGYYIRCHDNNYNYFIYYFDKNDKLECVANNTSGNWMTAIDYLMERFKLVSSANATFSRPDGGGVAKLTNQTGNNAFYIFFAVDFDTLSKYLDLHGK